MENPSFIKVNSPKHVCLSGYHRVFLIKTHWSYFRYNSSLHTLNVYKIPWKEHQGVDFWVTDETAYSKILFWKSLEYVPLI